jgi:hypothetical protein
MERGFMWRRLRASTLIRTAPRAGAVLQRRNPQWPLVRREKGTPQGGVLSPLLANLFLHYAFDRWMAKTYPQLPFERFADDAIVHCRTEVEAQEVGAAIAARMRECGLELHPEKTKIVYCKDDDRRRTYSNEKFDFLGYTFRPRRSKNRLPIPRVVHEYPDARFDARRLAASHPR